MQFFIWLKVKYADNVILLSVRSQWETSAPKFKVMNEQMPWDPNSEWAVFSHIYYIMISNWFSQQKSNEGPSLTINVQQSHKNRNL